ncbi:TerB family tellurite resistance protein [Marinoscillum sp. MHG1-6]|uniref:TerB family tellurite resistance protein n=1 Tax=Marinoscillum sp. MHG1-6 TaxID=2959627 RepID=UPI002157AA93|nr:TerB family tellurite resistance protein [Marinoscillum sp. MHG1-6]
MRRTHLNLLVQLARIDGVVVQEEIDLIKQIGEANGMSSDDITGCFEDPTLIEDLSGLTEDEKYEYIYSIVQLMKIDGRLYKEELAFCARMASKLGYDEGVLLELMLKIYSDPHLSADKELIKDTIQEYLIKK